VAVRGADASESDNADAPEPNDVDEEVPGSAGEHSDTVELTLADQQQQDPEFGSLARMRLQQTHPPANEEMQAESAAAKELLSQWDQLEVRDGIVYRRSALKNGRAEALQLLVPCAHRQDFLKKVHSWMTGGHLSVKRTMDQVQRSAFWPRWRGDVKRFCRQCQSCKCYFRGRLPRSGPLQPMLAGAPLEKLHFDVTGPHRSLESQTEVVRLTDG